MTKRDDLKAELKEKEVSLGHYYNDILLLPFSESSKLISDVNRLQKEIRESCPHDHVVVVQGTETDSGYGCDRYYTRYDIVCSECDKRLLNHYGLDNLQALTEEISLNDAVDYFDKKVRKLSNDDLSKLKFNRMVETKTYLIRGR